MTESESYSCIDIMDLCRVCLRNETEMSQLFDSNSNDSIIIRIQFCTGVLFTKTDVVPSKICRKCLEELNTAHSFKLKCLNSDKMYQDYIIIEKIKSEPGEYKNDMVQDDTELNGAKVNTTSDNECDVKNDGSDDAYSNINCDEKGFDFESVIKVEDTVVMTKSIRKAKRVRLKSNEMNSDSDDDKLKPLKQVKVIKRGPYKTAKQPRRLAKLKFRKLFCEGCNMKFNSKKESDEHKKEFHNEPQLWICEICGKSFAHRSSQHSHMRIHYPPQHACDHCDYKTANKHDLSKHLRIHSGNKSYICPICAAAYRTSSNLHAHVRLTHERLRKHACTLCARTFYDRTKLNRHMDSHNDVKRYSCEVCHSCFTRRCYWKKHLQKQHDIVIPSCRPGRPKAGIVLASTEKEIK